MIRINGETKITGLYGLPVEHSLSPAIHNAAFRALGLNYCYLPFRVEEGDVEAAVKAVRALGMVGVNVTAPHKQAVLPHLDRLSDEASFLGAVNTILHREGMLEGHNTDAMGFLEGLQHRISPREMAQGKALILGGGGAARAVAVGLVRGTMPELVFALRAPEKLEEWLNTLSETWPGTRVRLTTLGGRDFQDCLAGATLIVNTLPSLEDESAQDWFRQILAHARPQAFFSDLRYVPEESPFMALGRSLGCRVQNGLPMLLEQAVLSFSLFTGLEAPRRIMQEALNI